MQLLQLYAAAAVTGSATQVFADNRAVCLGASAAVNAMVIFSVLLNPTATYLLYGIVPAPAWALGTAWICWDTYGAYKVNLLALISCCYTSCPRHRANMPCKVSAGHQHKSFDHDQGQNTFVKNPRTCRVGETWGMRHI
jgi:hypothetical protein